MTWWSLALGVIAVGFIVVGFGMLIRAGVQIYRHVRWVSRIRTAPDRWVSGWRRC